MSSIYKKIIIAIILVLNIIPIMTSAKDVKLPDGRVLENAYVMSKRPNGLEVGHKRGIIFIKFEMMPEEIQKKYNYDPAAAKKYEADKLERQQLLAKQKQEKAAKQEAFNKEMDKRRFAGSLDRLEIDIKKTENRIAFLKNEIPRLQRQSDNLLNKTTSLAGKSVGGNNQNRVRDADYSRRNNNRYGRNRYDGGYYVSTSNTAGNKAEYTKRRTIDRLEDEYSLAKKNLKKYQKELDDKEIYLIKMKQKLQRGRASQK